MLRSGVPQSRIELAHPQAAALETDRFKFFALHDALPLSCSTLPR
jgi:hypothetical protein